MFIATFALQRTSSLKFNSLLNFKNIQILVQNSSVRKMSVQSYLEKARQCVPLLENSLHKGQAGRIGVVGGSFEYTGAPYFAAISALKFGADLVHVFCSRDAAIPIKSYSPELMVHPVLDDPIDPIKLIEPWLDRLHALVIGPGLGRNPTTLATIKDLIQLCRNKSNLKLVLDADALFLVSQDLSVISNYPGAILTPNVVEFERIFGKDDTDSKLQAIGKTVTVLKKGSADIVYSGDDKKDTISVEGGSGRRCGGQGDCLAGCTAVFFAWAIRANIDEPAKVACVAASYFVKKVNAATFASKGRSMTVTDMIEHMHDVFEQYFEHK